MGLPSVVLPVLVVGVLQRDIEEPQNCAIYGVPSYDIGTHLPRLCRRASSYLSQSLPLQSGGFSHALPELGPHIYVPPLRKAASYSFMNTLPIAHSQATAQSLFGHEARTRLNTISYETFVSAITPLLFPPGFKTRCFVGIVRNNCCTIRFLQPSQASLRHTRRLHDSSESYTEAPHRKRRGSHEVDA